MPKYNLIFSGEINNGLTLDHVKGNFKKKFNLTENQLIRIFSGKSITLKKGLSQQSALVFAATIDDLGGVAYIEQEDETVKLPPGIEKNRRATERRMKTQDRRRHSRGGIQFDRRINSDRRKKNT